jgi:hypothetical protein
VQAGPDAVYGHRRCADLEVIDRLAVIRASVSSAAVLDALPDPRRAPRARSSETPLMTVSRTTRACLAHSGHRFYSERIGPGGSTILVRR